MPLLRICHLKITTAAWMTRIIPPNIDSDDLPPEDYLADIKMDAPIGKYYPIPTHTMIIPLANVIQHYKHGSYLNGDTITLANMDPILHATYTDGDDFHDSQPTPYIYDELGFPFNTSVPCLLH